jgi:hypothetical protein
MSKARKPYSSPKLRSLGDRLPMELERRSRVAYQAWTSAHIFSGLTCVPWEALSVAEQERWWVVYDDCVVDAGKMILQLQSGG